MTITFQMTATTATIHITKTYLNPKRIRYTVVIGQKDMLLSLLEYLITFTKYPSLYTLH